MACPDCDEPLSLNGRFCKACGWDADLEERDDAYLAGIDIPDTFDEDAYQAALARDGLAPTPPGVTARRALTTLVALAVVLGLLAWMLR